tara:strand:+ start:121 stop:663 length:543 start_codon:yes stop_codon:yes gene_type:complete
MVNFFSPAPSGVTTDIAESGVSVKLIKRNGQFKLLKTNKSSISATIALIATPFGQPTTILTDWNLAYDSSKTTTDDGLDRVDTSLPASSPNITIFDTDVISFDIQAKLSHNPGDRHLFFLTDNNSVFPYSDIRVGTVINNGANSGLVQFHPGVGNTGTYYYVRQDDSTPRGGQINVISTP